MIGFPIGIDKRNSDRRALLRELWVSEYPNIGRTVRAEFVVGLLTYQGDGHDDATLDALAAEHERYGDLALVNAREPTRDPYRGDPKCTGEKLVAWFQRVIVVHRRARFVVNHTAKSAYELRRASLSADAIAEAVRSVLGRCVGGPGDAGWQVLSGTGGGGSGYRHFPASGLGDEALATCRAECCADGWCVSVVLHADDGGRHTCWLNAANGTELGRAPV